jgi:hypothetical protein
MMHTSLLLLVIFGFTLALGSGKMLDAFKDLQAQLVQLVFKDQQAQLVQLQLSQVQQDQLVRKVHLYKLLAQLQTQEIFHLQE